MQKGQRDEWEDKMVRQGSGTGDGDVVALRGRTVTDLPIHVTLTMAIQAL